MGVRVERTGVSGRRVPVLFVRVQEKERCVKEIWFTALY